MITVSKTFETEAEASVWLEERSAPQISGGEVTEDEAKRAYHLIMRHDGVLEDAARIAITDFATRRNVSTSTGASHRMPRKAEPVDFTDTQINAAINAIGDWTPNPDARQQMRRAFNAAGARPS